MIHNKKILRHLSHTEYEHEFDRKALNTLENTPGLSVVGRFITKHTVEKFFRVQYTGSNLKVTKETYPHIYEYLEYACQILDLSVPELYIQWGYNINACTIGAEKPIIVLHSGLIDLCSDDEILFIIGHECGHIKSNHMLYHMMAQVINLIIDQVPFGRYAGAAVKYALLYWDRMSEFTADRAGLLCCQNMKAAARVFMKIAGLPTNQYAHIDEKSFVKQAQDFDNLDYDKMSKFIKMLSVMDNNHPWTVLRTSQLINWVQTGEVQQIMSTH